MRRVLSFLSVALFLLAVSAPESLGQRKPSGGKTREQAPAAKRQAAPQKSGDEVQKSGELEEISKLAPAERVERLRAFIKTNGGDAPSVQRARELLTVARAALGDERLRASDRSAGIELFRAALREAPARMPDKLFFEVIAQLPANLYLLGEREAALELAREIEERARDNASRMLGVAAFYLGVEMAEEAARVASAAVALQPELSAAHQSLGAAHRLALRLDEATAAYARALELDPKSSAARRILADLLRASGKAEEALALYRELLADDPSDMGARTGKVLALFDAGRRDEAERELEAALFDQASNLPLLVGASYWYASRGEGARALELAERAVALEPRYRWAWARVAHARALLALNRPLEAERSLRAARELGSFPTLDYELASALAAAGLYDEAAETLARSFTVRDGRVETRLAGRYEASAEEFGALLAPERRAGLFQFRGADSPASQRMMKELLAFYLATRPGADDAAAAAKQAVASGRAFASGDDEMQAYRSLYVASRLSQRGLAHKAVYEQAEAAIGGVERALSAPLAPVALFADELRDLRVRAFEAGEEMIVPRMPREVLSKVLRGRIEEAAGWALYNEGQTAEAVVRLRRAVSVLPENTVWWRNAEWRLGAALEASGSPREALASYVKSYRLQPEQTRLLVIEALYKRLNNGSTEGLDALVGAGSAEAARLASQQTAPPSASGDAPANVEADAPANVEAEPVEAAPAEAAKPSDASETDASKRAPEEPTPARPSETETPEPATETTPTPEPSPASEPPAAPEPTPGARPSPEERESPTPEPSPSPADEPPSAPATPEDEAQPAVTSSPEHSGTPAPEPRPTQSAQRPPAPVPAQTTERPAERRRRRGETACALALSEERVSIKSNGGTATVRVVLENYTGAQAPRINPSTNNWADIIIFAEPRAESDGDSSARFTVTSVSRNTGAFIVSFGSPCGKRELTVNVQ